MFYGTLKQCEAIAGTSHDLPDELKKTLEANRGNTALANPNHPYEYRGGIVNMTGYSRRCVPFDGPDDIKATFPEDWNSTFAGCRAWGSDPCKAIKWWTTKPGQEPALME